LSLLSSVIVKLLSQADQVPYQGGEFPFGWEIQEFPIIEVFRSQVLSPWLGEWFHERPPVGLAL
jgi:hypothetical protein